MINMKLLSLALVSSVGVRVSLSNPEDRSCAAEKERGQLRLVGASPLPVSTYVLFLFLSPSHTRTHLIHYVPPPTTSS